MAALAVGAVALGSAGVADGGIAAPEEALAAGKRTYKCKACGKKHSTEAMAKLCMKEDQATAYKEIKKLLPGIKKTVESSSPGFNPSKKKVSTEDGKTTVELCWSCFDFGKCDDKVWSVSKKIQAIARKRVPGLLGKNNTPMLIGSQGLPETCEYRIDNGKVKKVYGSYMHDVKLKPGQTIWFRFRGECWLDNMETLGKTRTAGFVVKSKFCSWKQFKNTYGKTITVTLPAPGQ